MLKLFKNCLLIIFILFLYIGSGHAAVPVFEGAMGYGINTTAGNCGDIIKVTNLNASGPGSFVDALQTEGPRVVVFEVGGVIDLGVDIIEITEPYLSVAGQTAPSPGITLIKGGLQVRTHDVLLQHIRIRTGDANEVQVPWEVDALTTIGEEAHDIVIDHCSFSWGIDETLSVSGPPDGPYQTSHRVTLSNNIIAETLYDSIHPKGGPHSRATLIASFCQEVAVIRNIYAHNNRRHPVVGVGSTGVIVNNLVYDPGVWCMTTHGSLESVGYPEFDVDPPRWSIVGNHVIPGPSTTIDAIFYSWLDTSIDPAEIYFRNNICDDPSVLQTLGRLTLVSDHPTWAREMIVLPVEDVYDELLAHAGARPVDRDSVDTRIIQEIQNRTGGLIDSQNEVGGYPDPVPTYRTFDIPSSRQEFLDLLEDMARQVEGR
jgi:pectate lyase